MMEAKKFYKSKVFWFNVLAIIVLIANAFGFTGFKPDPEADQIAMFVILGVNLVLRYATKVPLKF